MGQKGSVSGTTQTQEVKEAGTLAWPISNECIKFEGIHLDQNGKEEEILKMQQDQGKLVEPVLGEMTKLEQNGKEEEILKMKQEDVIVEQPTKSRCEGDCCIIPLPYLCMENTADPSCNCGPCDCESCFCDCDDCGVCGDCGSDLAYLCIDCGDVDCDCGDATADWDV